jgi:hypothetical protein
MAHICKVKLRADLGLSVENTQSNPNAMDHIDSLIEQIERFNEEIRRYHDELG